jgi:hypothetical protein
MILRGMSLTTAIRFVEALAVKEVEGKGVFPMAMTGFICPPSMF